MAYSRRAAADAFALLTGGVRTKLDPSKVHPATLAAIAPTNGSGSSPAHHHPSHAAPAASPANGNGNASDPKAGSKRARKAAARAAAAAAAATDAAGGGASVADGGVDVFATGNKRARMDELSAPVALPAAPRTNDPFEAANAARKALRIRVAGGDAPALLESFEALALFGGGGGNGGNNGVPRRVLDNLATAGWDAPTPVQRQVIPALMRGREVFGIAPTGSGKTLAYALPIVATLAAARRDWARKQREELEQEQAAGGKQKDAKKQEKQKKKSKSSKEETNAADAARPPPYDPRNGPHALVLAPTAELAAQIGRVVERLTPGTGLRTCVLTAATAAGLEAGRVDVLVATPLRLVGLLGGVGGKGEDGGNKKGKTPSATPNTTPKLDLTRGLRFLVLDEADKLLSEDGGFVEQADAVLAAAGSRPWLARALLSATFPERVENLARAALRDPLRVTVGERGAATALVDQRLLFVGREEGKMPALRQLLLGNAAAVLGGGGGGGGGGAADAANPAPPPLIIPPILIFVSTKDRARQLHRDLMHEGGGRLRVDSISADQPNAARRAAVDNFRLGRTWVLIATDLIGRGMDFVGVNTVISYDFPRSGSDYVHRVGRTGRAGRRGGCAVTFFTEDDAPRLKAVAAIVKGAGGKVPEWMMQNKLQMQQQGQQQGQQGQQQEGTKKRRGEQQQREGERKNKGKKEQEQKQKRRGKAA
jgi:ATP-dependent RNA helicase DDX52/ROK1